MQRSGKACQQSFSWPLQGAALSHWDVCPGILFKEPNPPGSRPRDLIGHNRQQKLCRRGRKGNDKRSPGGTECKSGGHIDDDDVYYCIRWRLKLEGDDDDVDDRRDGEYGRLMMMMMFITIFAGD